MARRLLRGRARHQSDVAIALAEQRRQLARDVHDGVAQELAFIAGQLDRLSAQRADDPLLRELRTAAHRGLREARLTIDELRAARHVPLRELLRDEVASFESRTGVAVDLRLELACDVGRDRRIALLRILGQALANAADHGEARRVRVQVRAHAAGIELNVADDGTGFAPAAGAHGWGLLSMRERAELLGGSFSVDSAPGRGTEVAVSLP